MEYFVPLKRAALRDKALGALRDLASAAQFTDQGSARRVSIVIGIRPDLVKSLISAELDCTRASLRVRRKGRNECHFRLADGIPVNAGIKVGQPGELSRDKTGTGASVGPTGIVGL